MGADWLVPKEVAAELGVGIKTVLGFIAEGSLYATNVALGSRPRWRISREDLAAFLASRRSGRSVPCGTASNSLERS